MISATSIAPGRPRIPDSKGRRPAPQSDRDNAFMASTPHDDSEKGGGAPAQPGQAGPPQPPQGEERPKHPDDMIAQLRAEVADLKDKILRAHAEMENIRKRAERDREETGKYAVTKFARDILSVGDNFQRAIDAVPSGAAEQDAALKSFLEGVTMTERELLNVLERHGIRRIQPLNEPFNPHQHQAVMEIAREDVPAGVVVQVFQAGFTIEDRVLRPAMVGVAKGSPKPAQDTEGSGSTPPPPPANENPPPG
jgi:molecular chaperone GrpE